MNQKTGLVKGPSQNFNDRASADNPCSNILDEIVGPARVPQKRHETREVGNGNGGPSQVNHNEGVRGTPEWLPDLELVGPVT